MGGSRGFKGDGCYVVVTPENIPSRPGRKQRQIPVSGHFGSQKGWVLLPPGGKWFTWRLGFGSILRRDSWVCCSKGKWLVSCNWLLESSNLHHALHVCCIGGASEEAAHVPKKEVYKCAILSSWNVRENHLQEDGERETCFVACLHVILHCREGAKTLKPSLGCNNSCPTLKTGYCRGGKGTKKCSQQITQRQLSNIQPWFINPRNTVESVNIFTPSHNRGVNKIDSEPT